MSRRNTRASTSSIIHNDSSTERDCSELQRGSVLQDGMHLENLNREGLLYFIGKLLNQLRFHCEQSILVDNPSHRIEIGRTVEKLHRTSILAELEAAFLSKFRQCITGFAVAHLERLASESFQEDYISRMRVADLKYQTAGARIEEVVFEEFAILGHSIEAELGRINSMFDSQNGNEYFRLGMESDVLRHPLNSLKYMVLDTGDNDSVASWDVVSQAAERPSVRRWVFVLERVPSATISQSISSVHALLVRCRINNLLIESNIESSLMIAELADAISLSIVQHNARRLPLHVNDEILEFPRFEMTINTTKRTICRQGTEIDILPQSFEILRRVCDSSDYMITTDRLKNEWEAIGHVANPMNNVISQAVYQLNERVLKNLGLVLKGRDRGRPSTYSLQLIGEK